MDAPVVGQILSAIKVDEQANSIRERLGEFVRKNLFGADFDPFLVRATMMSLSMAANEPGNVFYMDSLAFPRGHHAGLEPAKKDIPLGSIDVLMTNPPFGSEIPITDPLLLRDYDLARRPGKADNDFAWGEGYQKAVAPEVLFIQRAVDWLKPGGRMGIVLPDGILGNPGDEYIRRWILRHTWVLASVDLPVEVFIVEGSSPEEGRLQRLALCRHTLRPRMPLSGFSGMPKSRLAFCPRIRRRRSIGKLSGTAW
jgi:type I restriction enzyme M protein